MITDDQVKQTKTERFIERSQLIHGDFYNYDNATYTKVDVKVCIGCKIHGDFYQTPNNHVNCKQGCPECGKERTRKKNSTSLTDQIRIFKEVHGDVYNYDLIEDNMLMNNTSKLPIICATHGVFHQMSASHQNGSICPSCANELKYKKSKLTTSDFIERSVKIHGNLYDYTKSVYNGSSQKVTITCSKHGDFQTTPDIHYQGCGCPICGTGCLRSRAEIEIYEFVKTICPDVEHSNRSILGGKEIDIFIPSLKLAIEFCGIYWHSEYFKDNSAHKNKMDACNNLNIRLITIFEDEWLDSSDIIKQKLRNILGVCDSTTYARKSTTRILTKADKKQFLNTHHIQGNAASSIDIGLECDGEVIACMSFINNSDHYILTRYATSHTVVGGFSKLLKYFRNTFAHKKIISFADMRWSSVDNVYTKTGWRVASILAPDYSIYFKGTRSHKFNFRRKYLPSKFETFDPNKSEHENCLENKAYRIYDCGKIKYEIY